MSSYKIHDFESNRTNGVTINNALNVTGISQLETLNVSGNADINGTLSTTSTLNINPIKQLLFGENYVSLSSLKTKLDKTQFAHSGTVGLYDTDDNSLLSLVYSSDSGYIQKDDTNAIKFFSDIVRFEQSADFAANKHLSLNHNNIYSVNQIGVDKINFSNVDGKLIFTEGFSSTSLLTLTDTGNVGIGITNPSTRLEVDGATTLNGDLTINTQKKIILSDGNSYGNDRYIYTKWEDSVNTHQIGLEYDYYTGSGGETSSHSRINFVSNAINDEDITGAGKLTTMSVLSNGNVGIGTRGPSEKLEVEGNTLVNGNLTVSGSGQLSSSTSLPTKFYRTVSVEGNTLTEFRSDVGGTNTQNCIIRADGDLENTNNSYGALSDIRLKENIIDANSQWEDIKGLKFKNYNFINTPEQPQFGVIAQEVEEISPGLVKTTTDTKEVNGETIENVKVVKTSVMYMKGMKALQEALLRIEKLEEDNKTLNDKLNKINDK